MIKRSGELNSSFRLSSKNTSIIRIVALTILGLVLLCGSALAHPPADPALTYDDQTGDLVVAITHPVDNPATHYVNQVTVRQGNTVLIDTSYTSQPDASSFTYRYNLPQLKGSSGEVTVDARCSLFGSRSGTLIMGGTPAPTAPAGAAPAPTKAPVCAFAALLAVGFVARRVLR